MNKNKLSEKVKEQAYQCKICLSNKNKVGKINLDEDHVIVQVRCQKCKYWALHIIPVILFKD